MNAVEVLRNVPNHVYQIRGDYRDGLGGYCAIGVLLLAIDYSGSWSGETREVNDTVERHYPGLNVAEIVYMNDYNNLTFGEIADFIEKISLS